MGNYKSRHKGTQHIIQTTDLTVNNSETLVDTELEISLRANKQYYGMLQMFVLSTAVADHKIQFVLPSGATGLKSIGTLSATTPSTTNAIATVLGLSGNAVNEVYTFTFTLLTSSTVGTIKIQYAQNTAEVSNSKVLKGSYLQIWEQQ